MDNEDMGRNNPPFQRYIPSCYRQHQKYIPSCYLMEKDGVPDQETEAFYMTEVIDGKAYRFANGRWAAKV